MLVKQHNGIESAFAGPRWTNGIVYCQFDSDVTATNRQIWRSAFTEWIAAVGTLNFVEGTGNNNYIQIHNSSTTNSSAIGMMGGPQDMYIVNWNCKFIIAHEIGHALGLIHEHQRSDRIPDYITIVSGNIRSGYQGQFTPMSATIYGDYDFDSVMHYGRCAFSVCASSQSTCDGFSDNCAQSCWTISVNSPYNTQWQYFIGQRNHLSQLDQSGMAQRYGTTCPPTITQSSSQAITAANSASCNNGVGHADNSYWRAFNMGSLVGSAQYNVTSVSFGVESANVTQSVTVRLYTTGNFPAGFPGSLTQIGTTTVSVTSAQTGTVVTTPLVAVVPAGTSQLVMELFTPNGETAGNLFFVGSNAAAQSGPSYLSAADCGVTVPTDTSTIGFPNMHLVFNINGSCGSGPGSLDVTNTNSSGPGSLSAAVNVANSSPSVKTITLNLPGSGPWTITTATLFIDAPVIIDGTSQRGYDGAFNRVYVEGATGVSSVFYLRHHGGTYIKGLGIYNYDNNGVTIVAGADWNFVDDCYIGFKKTASGMILHNTVRAPLCAAVGIQGNYNKVRRSTISGVYNGINIGEAIESPPTGLVSHDNLFEYNRIGTDPTGQTTEGYGNTSTGIFLGAGVQSSWIGGYNVIAGNGGSAVEILHPTDFYNRIYYNYLGVNDGGTQIIAGSTNNQGILIGNVARTNGAWGNVCAGNRYAGIIVASGDGNFIWNNTIGLNRTQTQAIGSQPSGIVVNVDGDRSPGVAAVRNSIQGNMVCNHPLNGIEIYDGVGNGVYNNWIGTNSLGQFFANTNWGVYLQNSSYNTGSGNAWGANGLGRVGQAGGTGNSIQ